MRAVGDRPEEARQAAALATRLGAAGADAEAGRFVLEVGPEGLRLRGEGLALRLDYGAGPLGRRLRAHGAEAVARACGLSRGRRPAVVDATGGLGRDAMVLASRGAEVTLVERDPLLVVLLEDVLGRARAAGSEAAARVRLVPGDAVALLAGGAVLAPEVVYLDPMFPPGRRRALVKQDMQLLQALCGEPEPDEDRRLLEAALAAGAGRVVVKRPRGAPDLGGLAPQQRLEGEGFRFDLYLGRA
ncbi:MAG: class I SAM-dependent methyltransferase [Planctomycetota bacterium]